MDKIIDYRDLNDQWIIVDVRSPGEFQDYTIPGAINIPLFSNEERKVIGTVYKQESIEKAKRLGVQMVGQRLPEIYESLAELKKKHKNIVAFCARGGMRSGSVCALFNALGFNIWQLWGGYKGYRQVVNEELPLINDQLDYIVLHGYTGTGKTEILHKLREQGEAVLDLEGAANHRGSLFGGVGLGKVASQKQFEALLYQQLKNRPSNTVFIEAESKKIGNVVVPEYIFNSMQEGRHILVESQVSVRAQRIVDEYIKGPNFQEEIVEAINKLKHYIGQKELERLHQLAEAKEYLEIAKYLIERYYDPMYGHKQKDYQYDLVVNSDDTEKASAQIIDWLSRKKEPLEG